jgi:hypothetical protein
MDNSAAVIHPWLAICGITEPMSQLPRLHVIACPVFQRELEVLAAEAPAPFTTRLLDMALHEGAAENLRAALQRAIDETTPEQGDSVALAYGLCNRGIIGLRARALPVVVPRAHDCIGMLLGSTRCYLEQLDSQPGTYFQSTGWLEHSPATGEMRQQNVSFGPGSTVTREELAARYGEENADYLLEQFQLFTRHYGRLAFIATPVPQAAQWEEQSREIARTRGWAFERLPGDLGWLRRLVRGDWNEREFLRLNPGQRIGLRHDDQLIAAEPAE